MPTAISLPQDATAQEQAARLALLVAHRSDYQYDHTSLAPLALVKDLPRPERFDLKHRWLELKAIARVASDLVVSEVRHLFHRPDEGWRRFHEIFPLLPKPTTTQTSRWDVEFARQRLAGVNPVVIRRIDTLPGNFQLADAAFRQVMGASTTIAGEAAAGRLYLADYAVVDQVQLGTFRGRPKYMAAPMALFCWRKNGSQDPGQLVPVAIQLTQNPGANAPVYFPCDGPGWSLAKTFVQVADASVYEAGTHLGRTHLLTEPFIVATARQLADAHPLAILLKPHFRFTLALNELARSVLINPGGIIDAAFAAKLSDTLSIAVRACDVDYHELALPTELRSRRVDDAALLPDYPYRDDALLVWQAVRDFVAEYLGLYYATDQDVANDYELQGWLQELTSPGGGRLRGVTPSGQLHLRAELEALVTQIVFNCGPQHAAVNYLQYDMMGFIPNMPVAAYAAPPSVKMPIAGQQLFDLLPPRSASLLQMAVVYLLASFRYDRLGQYPSGHFPDPRVAPVVARFQQSLRSVETQIDDRNATRSVPYCVLKPSLITNSTSS